MSKISVIIPVYNVEKYLEECLNSIVNQTFKDIEIICVNDCSTDNSLSILEEYAKKDNRIKIINLKQNIKQGGARNKGLDIAQGEYIMFVDSDDYIETDTIEYFYNAIDNNKCDLVASYFTNFANSDLADVKTLCESMNLCQQTYRRNTGFYNFNKEFENYTSNPVVRLYKKEIIDKYHIRFPEKLIQEDEAFYWCYFSVISNIYYIDKLFYHRRIHESGTMYNRNNFYTGAADMIKILEYIYNYLKCNNLYETYQTEYKKYFIKNYYEILNRCSKRQKKSAQKELNNLLKKLDINISKNNNFIQKIFSLKNIDNNKVITLFGKKIKLRNYKLLYKNTIKPLQEEHQYIVELNNISNIQIKPNSILLIEPNNSHGEIIPGFTKYLLDLGFNVDIIHYQSCPNCLCRLKDKRIRVFRLDKSFINLFLAMKKCEEYSFIFCTSHITYTSIGNFKMFPTVFEQIPNLEFYRDKLYVVEHHQDLIDKKLLENKHIITLAKLSSTPDNAVVANPHYFGEIKITEKSQEITQFIMIGAIEIKRKKYKLLIDTVKHLYNKGVQNFKITVIGRGSLDSIPPAIRKYFNILGRVSFDIMYNELEKSDFFLPLLDPNNPEHDRYITTGTSGSFQLIYGFSKPCIIAEKFAAIHGFNQQNSIVYKNNEDLANAMQTAINMNQEQYHNLQTNLAEYTDNLYQESLSNLREIIEYVPNSSQKSI